MVVVPLAGVRFVEVPCIVSTPLPFRTRRHEEFSWEGNATHKYQSSNSQGGRPSRSPVPSDGTDLSVAAAGRRTVMERACLVAILLLALAAAAADVNDTDGLPSVAIIGHRLEGKFCIATRLESDLWPVVDREAVAVVVNVLRRP
ncbi:hypothetical protein EVAR_76759_1 [Eumeta japonica]|uniref:Uncharacterized protein n=1 Tax=Eumeta variegata TaxID=151549 RepID=A0A4C1ST62_EUMVA|nr:hypothetical protein EVAR_76759_1 [Eumeta japonica]